MKTKLLFLAALFLFITFNSCSKYDDGPGISLRSKKSRVSGNWELKEWTINGEDALGLSLSDVIYCNSGGEVHYTETYRFKDFYWNFTASGKANFAASLSGKTIDYNTTAEDCMAVYMTTDMQPFYGEGSWAFESDKEDIKIDIENFYSDPVSFEIKELREKEMNLEGTDDSGDKHIMRFKKR